MPERLSVLSIPSASIQAADHVVIIVPTGRLSGFAGWFHRSRAILQARLLYASMGWLTFPAPNDGKKKGLKAKPKIGGFRWDATIDVEKIRKEFRSHRLREQNVGLPTGPENGFFVIETDTPFSDHGDVNGAPVLAAWEAENGKLPYTLMARSPSGSVHHFLLYPTDGRKVKSFSAIFGVAGVDCKAWGAMVMAAPSTRPGKPEPYQWINWGTPIAAAPEALLDVVVKKPREAAAGAATPPGAAAIVVNSHDQGVTHWKFVNDTALANLSAWFPALFPGGAVPYQDGYTVSSAWLGRDLQERISALPIGIRDFGLECGFTPIDLVIEHRGVDKFEAKAWLCERLGIEDEAGISFDVNEVVEPTTPAASFHELEAARAELERLISKCITFISSATYAFSEIYLNFARECGVNIEPISWAIRSGTGLGKTLQAIVAITRSAIGRVIYMVPNHYLSAEIEQRFLDLDVSVKIFRGRMQPDPENPNALMCLKPEEIKEVTNGGLPISKTCCKWHDNQCEHFEGDDICGYQRQKLGDAKVIVTASDMMFHDQPALGSPELVVIDESVWKKALRGVEDKSGFFIPLNDLKSSDDMRFLAEALNQQTKDGPIDRLHMSNVLDDQELYNAVVVEWKRIEQLTKKIKLRPGMSAAEFKRSCKKHRDDIAALKTAYDTVTLLQEIRWMLRRPEIKLSGRMLLEEREGIRGIRWRGVAPIVKRYKAPTLLLDATLPDVEVLRMMFPDIEIIGDVSADFPECVKVRQYLGSPSSANKLIHNTSKKPERYLVEIRRHILRRWIETGRHPTLVICQQKVEQWLKDKKLPDGIAVAHFNAISGLDAFKDVRLLIIIGRTIPNPNKVEAIAATLVGAVPKPAEADANGFYWYDRAKRVIRLRDGTGRATYGDQHPDELCESIRWLICEAELIQAIGRARGINRNQNEPLDIDLLFNEALPIVVDQVLAWEDASALIETTLDGVMLTSPIDLMRIWPALWPNIAKAKRTIAAGIPALPSFSKVEYHLAGPKMKRRTGYFDLNLIPDPLTWLEERLGPLIREE